jgi:hypothetical protein
VPYYASAFGATLVTDAVSGRDAIIFLAGTNLGAAVYEYGLARATGLFLRRRAPVSASPQERARDDRSTRPRHVVRRPTEPVENAADAG